MIDRDNSESPEFPVLQAMRVDPAEFQALRLRTHEFLSDVPLHDMWRLRLLGGGPGHTVHDVVAMFVAVESTGANPVARALFALCTMMGRAFGWDREPPNARALSYVNRVTAEDRARPAATGYQRS